MHIQYVYVIMYFVKNRFWMSLNYTQKIIIQLNK